MALPPFTDRDYFFNVPVLRLDIASGFIGGIGFTPHMTDIVVRATDVIYVERFHGSVFHDFELLGHNIIAGAVDSLSITITFCPQPPDDMNLAAFLDLR